MSSESSNCFPYCSLASFLIPLAYFVFMGAVSGFSSYGTGGLGYFDTPNAARNLMIGFIMIGVWMLVGLILNVASLIRGERYRALSIIGICLYIVPAVISAIYLGLEVYRL